MIKEPKGGVSIFKFHFYSDPPVFRVLRVSLSHLPVPGPPVRFTRDDVHRRPSFFVLSRDEAPVLFPVTQISME